MGLISTEVEVCLIGRNVSYYEKLGYEIPRDHDKYKRYRMNKGTKIIVRIEDLMPTSAIKVDVECDGRCGKILHPTYRDYNKHCHNGKYYCRACCTKILLSGKNHFNYNSNITDEERFKGRDYPEYNEFIKIVLARDNYTCQCCGKTSKDVALKVHHLDGYDWCREKRTDETNGITLCENCHSNFHTHYGYGQNTKVQFEEWIGRSVELIQSGIEILPSKQVYCIETNTVYNDVKDVCKKLNFDISNRSGIGDMCNKKRNKKSVHGYHFLWNDDYIKMSSSDISKFLESCIHLNAPKKVICLETREIFDSAKDASIKYSGSASTIRSSCRKSYKTSYGFHWMYYNDFLKLPIGKQNKILNKNQESSNDGSFVM